MTLVLPANNRKSVGQALAGGFAEGLAPAIQQYIQQQQSQDKLKKEDLAYPSLAGLSDPKLRQIALSEQLKGKSKKEIEQTKRGLQSQMETRDYDVIKDRYGKETADLWRAAPTGAKTDILEAIIEGQLRGLSVEEALGQKPITNDQEDSGESLESIPEEGFDETERAPSKTEGKPVDFDRGLTPAEKVKRQQQRYTSNLPLYESLHTKQRTAEMEEEELKILEDLSPKIGVLQRLNINPSTGQLVVPGLASAESQRFVKTINDFTRLAKDSYGSRVTNFDLDQFMKRLPTLANSEEGRRQIIQQMQLINRINQAHQKATLNIIEKYGGIRQIDFDRAQSMAEKVAKKEVKNLSAQFKLIGSQSEKSYDNRIKEKKKSLRKGFVLMEHNGEIGEVPEAEVKGAIKDGATVL